MATSQMSGVIRHLCRAVLLREGAGLTDGQLLENFLSHRDEAAVAALVRRHGPMVWGVCRRVLPNYHDAEDAFQATFLVLVRKAGSIQPREMVANWLYGVARRTALKARATVARRKERETLVAEMPEPAVTAQELWRDLRPLLDEELSRLPDKYRIAIVLCDLEGKTRKEAARHLGLPEGTLSGRLTRGRAMLAKRLARHGLAVSNGALAVVLAENAASASVPTSVVFSTIGAASRVATGTVSVQVVALTEGVLKAMSLTKFQTSVAAAIVIALLGLGGGLFTWQSLAAEQGSPPRRSDSEERAKGPDDNLKDTLLALDKQMWKASAEGHWEVYDRLLADDYRGFSQAYGRDDKAAVIACVKRERYAGGTIRDVEVCRVSKDVAILTYVYDCQVLSKGGQLLRTYRDHRASFTWAHRKSGWVLVFAQDSELPESARRIVLPAGR
jgi:RNA polymerase sigma factor (sigma-70 family)